MGNSTTTTSSWDWKFPEQVQAHGRHEKKSETRTYSQAFIQKLRWKAETVHLLGPIWPRWDENVGEIIREKYRTY